jgi:response regulator NasT
MSSDFLSPQVLPQIPAPAPRRRLLVVDDDRLVLATVVHGLTHAGFEVIDADNGDDAILLARQHRPELALLDIRMDGLSGFDVAAYLRDHLHIPFMFLSAFNDEATLAQIRALGALAYLVKPLDVAQIVPAVEQAYAEAQARARSAPPPSTARPEVVVPSPAPAAPAAAGQPTGEVALADPLRQPVALAVGILMHRLSLPRQAALERLQRLARQEGRPIEDSAAAMVAALEQLSLPGQL